MEPFPLTDSISGRRGKTHLYQKDITALTQQVILLKQIIDGMALKLEKVTREEVNILVTKPKAKILKPVKVLQILYLSVKIVMKLLREI